MDWGPGLSSSKSLTVLGTVLKLHTHGLDLAPSLTGCVTPHKLLNISELQLPHQLTGETTTGYP